MKLRRLPRDGFDMSRYLHPHGYVITREKRGWDERVGRIHGQADPPPPMYWWTVEFHIARRASMLEGRPSGFLCWTTRSADKRPQDFDTLADARAWCDANPRDGWASDRSPASTAGQAATPAQEDQHAR